MRHRFDALGSTCELLAFGLPVAALERAETWVREAQARFSRFQPESELNVLNRSGGDWVAISPAMARMIAACLDAYA